MKYVIIGSALSGNKGAASMLTASIQTLSAKDPAAKFTLLSIYPGEDQALNEFSNLTILSNKPWFLGGVLNGLSLIYKILPPLRPLLRRQKHVQALAEADIFLDQSGLTFVDGREMFLIYNIACVLPGILITKKVIKCSQALGPFKHRINRLLSKLVLPKLSLILARGAITRSYLDELGLKNFEMVADYAFAMTVDEAKKMSAEKILQKYKIPNSKNLIIVSPSQVMLKKSTKAGIDYVAVVGNLINRLTKQGFDIILLSHSAKQTNTTHNNDLPLCREIYNQVVDKNNCYFLNEVLDPQELRHVIGKAKILITSRFHAMVSGLSQMVPVIIIGWNHKYKEVLEMFEIEAEPLTLKDLKADSLNQVFDQTLKDISTIKNKIEKNLPKVIASARRHTELIEKVAKGR